MECCRMKDEEIKEAYLKYEKESLEKTLKKNSKK